MTHIADSPVGLDDLVADHEAQIPPVTPEAVETERRRLAEESNPREQFDPAIHETGPHGGPVFNIDGTLRRKRGRKPRARGPDGKFVSVEAQEEQEAAAAAAMALGTTTAQGIFTLCVVAFGEAWRPRQEESSALADAWAAYYRASGITEPPPWVMLLVAHAAYALPRLRQEETRSRFAAAVAWLRRKVGGG